MVKKSQNPSQRLRHFLLSVSARCRWLPVHQKTALISCFIVEGINISQLTPQLRTNLLELNNNSPAPFSNDVLVNYWDYIRRNEIVLFPHYTKAVADIPLKNVIGIDQMYGDMTWGQCLTGKGLKRIESNLEHLDRNPSYYLSATEKSGLSLKKIGDNYFISTGKHRVILARFLEHFNPDVFSSVSPLRNIDVYEYFVDTEFMDFQREISALKKAFPELYFSLTYSANNEQTCLTIHRINSSLGCENYTRSEIPGCIDRLKNKAATHQYKASLKAAVAKWFRKIAR